MLCPTLSCPTRCRPPSRPLEEGCTCMVCRHYTRAFLHPVVAKNLPFASNLVTYHNIAHMQASARTWP